MFHRNQPGAGYVQVATHEHLPHRAHLYQRGVYQHQQPAQYLTHSGVRGLISGGIVAGFYSVAASGARALLSSPGMAPPPPLHVPCASPNVLASQYPAVQPLHRTLVAPSVVSSTHIPTPIQQLAAPFQAGIAPPPLLMPPQPHLAFPVTPPLAAPVRAPSSSGAGLLSDSSARPSPLLSSQPVGASQQAALMAGPVRAVAGESGASGQTASPSLTIGGSGTPLSGSQTAAGTPMSAGLPATGPTGAASAGASPAAGLLNATVDTGVQHQQQSDSRDDFDEQYDHRCSLCIAAWGLAFFCGLTGAAGLLFMQQGKTISSKTLGVALLNVSILLFLSIFLFLPASSKHSHKLPVHRQCLPFLLSMVASVEICWVVYLIGKEGAEGRGMLMALAAFLTIVWLALWKIVCLRCCCHRRRICAQKKAQARLEQQLSGSGKRGRTAGGERGKRRSSSGDPEEFETDFHHVNTQVRETLRNRFNESILLQQSVMRGPGAPSLAIVAGAAAAAQAGSGYGSSAHAVASGAAEADGAAASGDAPSAPPADIVACAPAGSTLTTFGGLPQQSSAAMAAPRASGSASVTGAHSATAVGPQRQQQQTNGTPSSSTTAGGAAGTSSVNSGHDPPPYDAVYRGTPPPPYSTLV